MAVNTVRAHINGTWVTLTKNVTTGKYEGTIAAPNITSYNVNSGHYYPVTVEATDLAGNIATANDLHSTLGNNLKLLVKEVTKPTIVFTAPASGAFLATNTPTISFQLRDEANGSGVKISTLSIKVGTGSPLTNTSPGVVVTTVTGGYNINYTPTTALTDGSHTIMVNVEDNDGNAAVAVSRTFVVDTIPPVLSITSPTENTTYRNVADLQVNGVTNDATSSVASVTITLNSVDQGEVTVDVSGNFNKLIKLTEGTNTIVIKATDRAGKTTTATRTVILDTVAPVVKTVTITPNPVNVGQSYVISIDVTD